MALKTLRNHFMAALAMVFVFAAMPAAEAQSNVCAAHDDVVAKLSKSFQEKQQAFGLIGNKAIVELFVSGKGSWTIIVTGTDGKTCVIAAGEGWENVPVLIGSEV